MFARASGEGSRRCVAISPASEGVEVGVVRRTRRQRSVARVGLGHRSDKLIRCFISLNKLN